MLDGILVGAVRRQIDELDTPEVLDLLQLQVQLLGVVIARVVPHHDEAYSEGVFEDVERECGGDGLLECVQGAAVVGAGGFSRT